MLLPLFLGPFPFSKGLSFAGNAKGCFSFWSNRGSCKKTQIGWEIQGWKKGKTHGQRRVETPHLKTSWDGCGAPVNKEKQMDFFSCPMPRRENELWMEFLACPHMGVLWVWGSLGLGVLWGWGSWKELFGSPKVQMAFPGVTQIFSTLGTPKGERGGSFPHLPPTNPPADVGAVGTDRCLCDPWYPTGHHPVPP